MLVSSPSTPLITVTQLSVAARNQTPLAENTPTHVVEKPDISEWSWRTAVRVIHKKHCFQSGRRLELGGAFEAPTQCAQLRPSNLTEECICKVGGRCVLLLFSHRLYLQNSNYLCVQQDESPFSNLYERQQ